MLAIVLPIWSVIGLSALVYVALTVAASFRVVTMREACRDSLLGDVRSEGGAL